MKKLLLTVALLAFATTVGAAHFGAHSISGTGTSANAAAGGVSTGNGAGFAVQGTSTGARNVTAVQAYSGGNGSPTVKIGSGVASAGTTYSVSAGIQGVSGTAISGGVTNGVAVQGGAGRAFSNGFAIDVDGSPDSLAYGVGFARTRDGAAQGSISATSNVNNGLGIDVAFGVAGSQSTAFIDIDAAPHLVTVDQGSNTDVIAGGGSASAVFGGGSAFGAGGGISRGNAGTLTFEHIISLP